MWKQIKGFHCAGKRLLPAIPAIPFLGCLSVVMYSGVDPQGRNTKPHSIVLSSTFFLPARPICLLFPSSSAFVGTFSWPGISSRSPLSQLFLLPDSTLDIFCSSFALALTPGRVRCQPAQPPGVLCCFLWIHKPLSRVRAWCGYRG